MVFKVFCDITVSHITSEDLCDNENICYEFVQKFDDNKENWDPNDPKKHSSELTLNSVVIPTKKEQRIEVEQKDCKTKDKIVILEKDDVKENKIEDKENPIQEGDNEKENVKGKEIKLKSDNIKEEEKENNEKSVSSTSTSVSNDTTKIKANDTTELKANDTTELKGEKSEDSENVKPFIKKGLLGKRQRMPLEDVTYLYVPEMRVTLPKRVKIVKEGKCKSPEASITKVLKISKSTPQKENKEFVNVRKVHKVFSEKSKENIQPVRKAPLGNISNFNNINNNNHNMKNSNISNNIPKPFFVNVKKNKSVKKCIIPKKSLNSKPNSYNISARMLR